MTWNQARYDEAAFAELRRHFDDAGIVELTMVAAFRNLMNRYMDSLLIELESEELQAKGGKAYASREALHAYLERLLEQV